MKRSIFIEVAIHGGPCVASLHETAFEDLHDTVRSGVAIEAISRESKANGIDDMMLRMLGLQAGTGRVVEVSEKIVLTGMPPVLTHRP